MKRKVLSLLLCGLLACSTLTACGGNDTTTGDIPVTDASGQETNAGGTVEVAEPTTEETEPATEETETIEEVESTEEVAGDFLSQHGISIYPSDGFEFDVTVPLAIGSGDTLTDDVEDVPIHVFMYSLVLDNKEGYSQDVIKVTMPLKETGNTFNITAFDRYTGKSFESAASNLDDGAVNQSVIVDVDGTKYDCSHKSYTEVNDNNECIITYSVTYPSDYDGVVFGFGKATKTQADIYNNIDFSSEFTIADYPDVFIDGQTFFTISGK